MLKHAAGHLARRAVEVWEDSPAQHYDLPPWTGLVTLLNIIIFLPLLFYIGYTLHHIYPVLAMVEDEAPPAYEPVPLQDEDLEPAAGRRAGQAKPDGQAARSTSSSVFAMGRLLRADAGYFGYLKGFMCAFVIALCSGLLHAVFSSFLPGVLSMVAVLLAELALVQFSAAWVHIIITPRSARRFWHRLPPFRKAFDATALPTVALWAGQVVVVAVPTLMAWAMHVPLSREDGLDGAPVDKPDEPTTPAMAGKGASIALVALVLSIVVQMPLTVVLVRVQASLLPADESTLIPFDRSFQGRVDPAVVTGKGYATMSDAWATFSRAAWARLIKLYLKIFAFTIGLFFCMAVVIGAELAVVAAVAGK